MIIEVKIVVKVAQRAAVGVDNLLSYDTLKMGINLVSRHAILLIISYYLLFFYHYFLVVYRRAAGQRFSGRCYSMKQSMQRASSVHTWYCEWNSLNGFINILKRP